MVWILFTLVSFLFHFLSLVFLILVFFLVQIKDQHFLQTFKD